MPSIDRNSVRSYQTNVIRIDQRQNHNGARMPNDMANELRAAWQKLDYLLDCKPFGLENLFRRSHV